jgi:hypothetical protein
MIRWFAIIICFIALFSCEKRRTPVRHLIPADYEGVVITVYSQKGFPELPIEDGYLVCRYPEDGILITSSGLEFGRAADQTFDSRPDGSWRPITTGNVGDRREHFAASGYTQNEGEPKIESSFRVIGSVEYWDGIDATEYDRKTSEAVRKLLRLKDQANKAEMATPRKPSDFFGN